SGSLRLDAALHRQRRRQRIRARLLRSGVRIGRIAREDVTASGPSPDTRAIVLDIEGTTTPISFVSQTLFPYARRHLRQYLEQHDDDAAWAALTERFRRAHRADRPAGADAPPCQRGTERAWNQTYGGWRMARDRKSTAPKAPAR